jgi:hypothetical protein
MKPLKQLYNVEKGKLVADLFPEQIPNITLFMEQEIQRFLKNEEVIKSQWGGTLLTSDFWYKLVPNAERTIKKYGTKFSRNHRLFADQLFDGYQAFFTIHCLVEYSHNSDCNYILRQAIRLFFGCDKMILSHPNNK